jgi:mRNA interferase MazF
VVIRQGDVYWLALGRPDDSAPAGRRPALVVQHDRFNRSAISTTVVAAITSSLRLAAMPGNVRLARGEGGLPRASVVNVSQRVGAIPPAKLRLVVQGLALLLGTDALAAPDSLA